MKTRRLAAAISSFILLTVPLFGSQPPPGQTEFVPI
jgi:hypothetical protein